MLDTDDKLRESKIVECIEYLRSRTDIVDFRERLKTELDIATASTLKYKTGATYKEAAEAIKRFIDMG